MFSEQVPEREDDDEEEEEEMNSATMARLKDADERTKGMTREEYVHYSECRQASFTFRKGKRFREWAGFGIVTDSKPNDDIVDILGFLTFEIVQTLTEEALRVKKQEDEVASKKGLGDAGKDKEGQGKKRKRERGLFDEPEEGRTPVSTRHVQEAFRRLQQKPVPGRIRVWLGGPRSLQRKELKLVSIFYFEWLSDKICTDIESRFDERGISLMGYHRCEGSSSRSRKGARERLCIKCNRCVIAEYLAKEASYRADTLL